VTMVPSFAAGPVVGDRNPEPLTVSVNAPLPAMAEEGERLVKVRF